MSPSAAAADGPSTTVDAFIGGGVEAIQPARGHHRSGLEAVLLGAGLEADFAGTIVDLGAGAGVAGMIAAARCRASRVVLAERDGDALACARAALTRPANAAFAARISTVSVDVESQEAEREVAGLARGMADAVLTNPPFHTPATTTVPPGAARRAAHVLGEGGLDRWFRTAASVLAPGGRLVVIFRADAIAGLLAALGSRFGALDILPIQPRADEPAHRIMVGALKGSRAATRLLPALVLHGPAGNAYLSSVDAILRHGAGLSEAHRSGLRGPEMRGEVVAFSLKSLLPARFRGDSPVVPVVRLAGMIGGGGPLRAGLTLESVAGPLARAFAVKSAPAVALVVNSPGGAAAQSHLIFRRIRALAEEKKKKVIVAVEDLAASGGYMIAAAGDEIVVDESSIVGSIGVVSAGFGFTRLIERIGIERRVHTAGKSKAMLDPFRPEREEDVARLRAIQENVHAAFIGLVKARRGSRLADDPDLFTGAFWSGAKAVDLGLADRVGDLRSVLREAYGEKVRLKVIPAERSMLRRRLGLGGSDRLAARLVERTAAVIEEHLMWSRFGL